MGKLLSVYKGIGFGLRTWIFILLPISVAIILTLSFGTIIAWQNYLKYGPASALYQARPWYITATVLIFFLVPYFLYRLLYSLRRIYIFDEGIVYRNLILIRRRYHWLEIKGITSSARAITVYNKHIRTEPTGNVFPKTGKPIKLTNRFNNIPQIIQEIKSMLYPQIWPNMKSNYLSGKEIHFGQISISNKHLSISEKPLSWESIYRIRVETGDVLIELHDHNHIQVPVSEVLNLELFFQIVDWAIS